VDPDIDISLQVGRLATSEVLAILRPAVMNGDVKLVGALLAAANERGEELDLDLLLQLAAWKGPDTIIEFMVFQVRDMHARNKSDETHLILQNALLVAVVVNNIDAVRCLIRNGAKADGNGIIHGEVRNQYLLPSRLMPPKNWKRRAPIIDYAFTKCNGDMVEILTENINPQYVVPPRVITNIIAKRESAQFAANLSKLGKFVSREGYSHGIHMAIQYTDEIALAICLKNGGDWNFIHKSGAYSVWGYPLMHAVNMFNTITIPSGSLNNIKRLLRAGADPYPKTSGQKNDVSAIMDLPQMKKLEEHIGMSWDALVQDIQGEP
jgi:hypothetical protein